MRYARNVGRAHRLIALVKPFMMAEREDGNSFEQMPDLFNKGFRRVDYFRVDFDFDFEGPGTPKTRFV